MSNVRRIDIADDDEPVYSAPPPSSADRLIPFPFLAAALHQARYDDEADEEAQNQQQPWQLQAAGADGVAAPAAAVAAAARPAQSENDYIVMFGGPELSFRVLSEGPYFVYVPRRANQRPGYVPAPLKPTVKVDNGVHLLKDSLKLVHVEDDGHFSSEDDDDASEAADTSSLVGRTSRRGNNSTSRRSTSSKSNNRYTLYFEFDSRTTCEVLVHVVVNERKSRQQGGSLVFLDRSDGAAQYATRGFLPVYRFAPGMGHVYRLPIEHAIDFDVFVRRNKVNYLEYDAESDRFAWPLVIEIRATSPVYPSPASPSSHHGSTIVDYGSVGAADGAALGVPMPSYAPRSSTSRRSQANDANVEYSFAGFYFETSPYGPSNFRVKAFKYISYIDGHRYELAEIYENTQQTAAPAAAATTTAQPAAAAGTRVILDDHGHPSTVSAQAAAAPTATAAAQSEDETGYCVICMSDVADTALIPCRHCCVCLSCAGALVQQSDRCPICRALTTAMIRLPKDAAGIVYETLYDGQMRGAQAASGASGSSVAQHA